MKKIFVSGGSGVIGRRLVHDLYAKGYELLVGDLKRCPNDFKDLNINYREGDLNQMTLKELEDFSPDYFIHLAAAFERTEESYGFWKESFLNNVCLSNHLMSISMQLKSIKKVIFASSYLIYDEELYLSEGIKDPVILNESSPIYPRNLTGTAKLLHEKELDFIAAKCPHKFDICSLRIFRGYGYGSRDIISRWTRDLLHEKEITIFNAENSFDYIFCEDSSSAIINVLTSEHARGIINVAYGESVKIKDICRIFKLHFPNAKFKTKGKTIRYENSQADISKLRETTEWKPEISIEEGIKKIIDYEKTHLEKL